MDPRLDAKTVTTKYTPIFDKCWYDPIERDQMVEGKDALKVLRGFYRENLGKNLSQSLLIEKLVRTKNKDIRSFIDDVFHVRA